MKNLIYTIWAMFLLPLVINCQLDSLVIYNANYFDTASGSFKKASLLLVNNKISKISAHLELSDYRDYIDATDKWVIPGLIDGHIHFFQSGGIYTRPDVIDLRSFKSYESEKKWITDNTEDMLNRYLRLGITTLIDVGGPMSNYKIREQFSDHTSYPNILVTGPLISTYQPEAFKIEDSPIIKCSTSQEAIALVQKQIPYNPDFIKIWYIALPTQTAEDTYEIVEATIKESHRHGLKVAVHATQLNTAKLAIKAGADILVHSVDDKVVDSDFVKMLVDNDVSYVPALVVSKNYLHSFARSNSFSMKDLSIANPYTLGSLFETKNQSLDSIFQSFREFLPQMEKRAEIRDSVMFYNLKKLTDAGANICTGTDAGNIGTLHASSYYKELDYMLESKISPSDILLASTSQAALAFGKEDEIGSIKEGLMADLLILDNNPLDDLHALKDIYKVIKSGKVYVTEGIVKIHPEDLIQHQLNAYNARNIDAFLAPYSDSIEIFNFPDQLIAKGKAEMRSIYKPMFESTPDLHCELVNRISLGNTVIDQERVTGFKNKEPINAVATYLIKDGKISKVYFQK